MELKASRNRVNLDVWVTVGPHSLVFRNVCSEEVQDHGGHIVAESGRCASLVEGKPVLISCETQPFFQEGLSGLNGIVGIGLESQCSFLVHLGVKEAGQNGSLWVGGVGGERDRECLFGVLPLVWVE